MTKQRSQVTGHGVEIYQQYSNVFFAEGGVRLHLGAKPVHVPAFLQTVIFEVRQALGQVFIQMVAEPDATASRHLRMICKEHLMKKPPHQAERLLMYYGNDGWHS